MIGFRYRRSLIGSGSGPSKGKIREKIRIQGHQLRGTVCSVVANDGKWRRSHDAGVSLEALASHDWGFWFEKMVQCWDQSPETTSSSVRHRNGEKGSFLGGLDELYPM